MFYYTYKGGSHMIDERIKELREGIGLTQSELSRRLGITRASVNAWEMGISVPSTQYLVLLSEIFGVTTDYLLGISDKEYVSTEGLTEEDIAIIHRLIAHLKTKK